MTKSHYIIALFCLLFLEVVFAQQNKSTKIKSIKIGLLVTNNTAKSAQHGAEMAVFEANKTGGINGRKFQLITRSMKGPWGTGSKQAVDLIFNENVWALMGSHDGRNAHLVEQVIAKTQVVFLSAWASDPSLSQAFVPWYFSCVPNNIQQAKALIKNSYKKRNIDNMVVISSDGYSSKRTLQNLLKSINIAGKTKLTFLNFDNYSDKNISVLLDTINKIGAKGVLLLGHSKMSIKFIKKLRDKNMNQPVFGTLSLLDGSESPKKESPLLNNITLVSSKNWLGKKGRYFRNKYLEKYGKIPNESAAYAYDGMMVIINAIKKSWPNRENLQQTMSHTNYEGFTGAFHFDNKGNRIGTIDLVVLKNGIPILEAQ